MATSIFEALARSNREILTKCLRPISVRFFGPSGNDATRRGSSRRFSNGPTDNAVKSSYPTLKIPDVPLHEFVFENLAKFEGKIALECAASGRKWTFAKVLRTSEALAHSLVRKFKLRKGDRVAVVLPNCPEYPVLLCAGSISGIIPTTVNPIYTSGEISHQLKNTGAKVVFTVPEIYDKCTEATNLIKVQIPIVVVQVSPESEVPPGAVSFTDLTEGVAPEKLTTSDFRSDDVAVLPYSSGTSGLPKGVELTHRNLIANLIQYRSANELKMRPDPETNQSLILGILPMFHIYGMVVVSLDSISEGGRLVTMPRFDPNLFITTISEKKLQILYLVPPLIFFLSNYPGVEPKHLQHVQHVVTGAAPCGTTDIEKLWKKCKTIQVSQGYGMTETSPVITISHKDRFNKIGSIGHPVANTVVKVADVETGRALPVRKQGEICVKGPQVMKGYFNCPEETKDTFDSDGWLKTGDIGYYDEEHDFYIVDRLKELIKVKGFQVAPAELEEFIRTHKKVADVGVIGVKHPQYGEVPRAFVVIRDGVTCTEEEIKDYVKDMLSPHKQLHGGVRFLKQIPKSGAGKILRKNLRTLNDDDETR